MPLKEEELVTWAQGEGITTPFSYDDLPDREPHRVYMIRMAGGLGLETESLLDRPTFQIMTRGVNGKDARDIALVFDELWLDQEEPFFIGSSKVVGVGRFGGPPTPIGIDDYKRAVRAATYWARISRKEV